MQRWEKPSEKGMGYQILQPGRIKGTAYDADMAKGLGIAVNRKVRRAKREDSPDS
jgi:hypothetical protein